MMTRKEFGIVVAATAVPLALIGALAFGGHHAQDGHGPTPPAVVNPVPNYQPAPGPIDCTERTRGGRVYPGIPCVTASPEQVAPA